MLRVTCLAWAAEWKLETGSKTEIWPFYAIKAFLDVFHKKDSFEENFIILLFFQNALEMPFSTILAIFSRFV